MTMRYRLKGFNELLAAFEKAPDIVTRELNAWMQAVAMHMESEVQERTPKRDGTLQKSIQSHVESVGPLGVSAVIGTPLRYAPPVEYGSRPHDIVAKHAKALHFMLRGVPVFVKKVRHPGTKGAFMFGRAFEANVSQIQNDFTQFVAHVINLVAREAK